MGALLYPYVGYLCGVMVVWCVLMVVTLCLSHVATFRDYTFSS